MVLKRKTEIIISNGKKSHQQNCNDNDKKSIATETVTFPQPLLLYLLLKSNIVFPKLLLSRMIFTGTI